MLAVLDAHCYSLMMLDDDDEALMSVIAFVCGQGQGQGR